MIRGLRHSVLGTGQVAGLLLAASVLLTACATDGRREVESVPGTTRGAHSRVQVRLETEEGPLRTFVPPRITPVEVTPAQFDATMARLVAGLELPSPPRHRLTLVACGQPAQQDEGAELTRGYQLWCERRSIPGDCLSLLGNARPSSRGANRGSPKMGRSCPTRGRGTRPSPSRTWAATGPDKPSRMARTMSDSTRMDSQSSTRNSRPFWMTSTLALGAPNSI